MSERRDEGSDDRRGNPVAFRGRGFAPRPVPGVGLAVFVILIAAAELGTRTGWISALTLPRPSAVFATFVDLWRSGQLWIHLVPSLRRILVGGSIGIGVGVSLGVMIGLFGLVRAGLVPLVAALFPIPKIALLPLFVVWFGIDEASKYALIAFGTWPVMATSGIESSLASAMAVSRLVAPGPEEAMQTATSPETRAMPWAMKPAPCSWRASTWRIAVDWPSAS